MLMDISNFTSSLQISQNGLAFVFTEDMKLIGLPKNQKFTNLDSLKKYILQDAAFIKDSILESSLEEWKPSHEKLAKAFSFEHNGENWWCEVKPYTGCHGNTFYIGVVVPEEDFMQEVKKTRTVFIGGFMLVLALTLMVIRGYNQKQKANNLLANQKAEIENQRNKIQLQKEHIEEIHHELKSSIQYAERIQKAVLPKEDILKKYLLDLFILFKPRDIVSGDFYWMFGKDDYLVVTVADCTGHGVPGAFMSMLGVSFLSEIVGVRNIFDAAEILNLLRNKIITTLEQKESSEEQDQVKTIGVEDGMDMALVVINIKNGTLAFAGANNPMLLISNEQNAEIQTYKADKMPVAISDRKQPFSQTTIEFKTGDQIYLFSDGFADQFGGPAGKKFMLKQLKETLQKNSTQASSKQKDQMNQAIEEWKSHIEADTQEQFCKSMILP